MRRNVCAFDPQTGAALASLPAAVVLGWTALSDAEIIRFTKPEFVTLQMLSRDDLERARFEVREG
ncbi:hypothetical protein [Caulobacter sp. S45]|uniref:hypothetical protein n=1 Tax=Caulobacter sp. S45 TaxID=1641861 RepID=UPI00131C5767|nr:hypothetical protein [Caulobacter sp. S45]